MTRPENLAKRALENATVTGKLQGMLLTSAIFLTAFAINKSNKQDAPAAPRAREPKRASKFDLTWKNDRLRFNTHSLGPFRQSYCSGGVLIQYMYLSLKIFSVVF